ncbi:hypothetical protein LOK49_Contig3G00011 [Camellia lanceoleosa]|nr:hypothetical protein LOK49_Contig3G00011 [Camellia lanceoleosa]
MSDVVAVNLVSSNVRCSVGNGVSDEVIDVDEVDVCTKKKSGFDINNRHGVWKMMTVAEKKNIKDIYDRDGDRAMM